jgi:hypothetical protein
VADASGRGSRVSAWLAELGYPQPAVQELEVHVRYASQRLRTGAQRIGPEMMVLVGPKPAARPGCG